MKFFLPAYHFEKLPKRISKWFQIFLKILTLLLLPLPYTAAMTLFWYYILFKRDIHLSERMEVIVTAAWIPIFGILYSLLAAVVVSTVWEEYRSIRIAVKEYDFETFINLRDEEMSPLVYILVGVVSIFVLASFMSIKYPEWEGGVIVIASTSYVLCLLFLVVKKLMILAQGFGLSEAFRQNGSRSMQRSGAKCVKLMLKINFRKTVQDSIHETEK